MPAALPAWALEMAWASEEDTSLPSSLDANNLVLNRTRLANFLAEFAEDRDVQDLLALDVLGITAGLPLSSTGIADTTPSLATRPFRIWEYAWIYKSLGLSAGGLNVLDLGGPASHLSVLAALAGCHVTSVDINPAFVQAAQACAEALHLASMDARLGDMRKLSAFSDATFDAVICCSVLEHLTAPDQMTALCEMARVLKPGGLIGLTFDLGPAAPGANEHLPPPHEPPPSSAEALHRYLQGGLVPAGNPFSEDPIPGSLFRHESVRYTVASLFLAKPPAPEIRPPQCRRGGSGLDGLVIQDLPHRIHQHLIAAMAQNNARTDLEEPHRQFIAQLRAEISNRDGALGDVRQQLEDAINSIHEYQLQVVAKQKVLADAEQQRQQLESSLDLLKAENNALRQRVRSADESLLRYLTRRIRQGAARSR